MKRTVFAIVVAFLLGLPASAGARGYFMAGGGYGGQAEAGNMRVEAGGYFTDRNINFLFGMGVPFTINRGDSIPSHTDDRPSPTPNYTSLGTKKKGEEAGLYGKVGVEPIRNSGVYLFGLGGVTWGEDIELVRSNVTGWYYTQSRTTQSHGLVGGGVGYYPKTGRICAALSYDNRMGVTATFGFSW